MTIGIIIGLAFLVGIGYHEVETRKHAAAAASVPVYIPPEIGSVQWPSAFSIGSPSYASGSQSDIYS